MAGEYKQISFEGYTQGSQEDRKKALAAFLGSATGFGFGATGDPNKQTADTWAQQIYTTDTMPENLHGYWLGPNGETVWGGEMSEGGGWINNVMRIVGDALPYIGAAIATYGVGTAMSAAAPAASGVGTTTASGLSAATNNAIIGGVAGAAKGGMGGGSFKDVLVGAVIGAATAYGGTYLKELADSAASMSESQLAKAIAEAPAEVKDAIMSASEGTAKETIQSVIDGTYDTALDTVMEGGGELGYDTALDTIMEGGGAAATQAATGTGGIDPLTVAKGVTGVGTVGGGAASLAGDAGATVAETAAPELMDLGISSGVTAADAATTGTSWLNQITQATGLSGTELAKLGITAATIGTSLAAGGGDASVSTSGVTSKLPAYVQDDAESIWEQYLNDFYGIKDRASADEAYKTNANQTYLGEAQTALQPYQAQLTQALADQQSGTGDYTPFTLSFGGKPASTWVPKGQRTTAQMKLDTGKESAAVGSGLAQLKNTLAMQTLPGAASDKYSTALNDLMKYLTGGTTTQNNTTSLPEQDTWTKILNALNTGTNIYSQLFTK